jgi:hypothetical protein
MQLQMSHSHFKCGLPSRVKISDYCNKCTVWMKSFCLFFNIFVFDKDFQEFFLQATLLVVLSSSLKCRQLKCIDFSITLWEDRTGLNRYYFTHWSRSFNSLSSLITEFFYIFYLSVLKTNSLANTQFMIR